jgi:hypothetical protein
MKPVIKRTRTSLIARSRGARADGRKLPATRLYRISKSFAVVHLEQTGQGRIVFLPKGGELRLVGWSPCLGEGFEVEYKMERYSIFKADLLGPWSDPIGSDPIGSDPIESNQKEGFQSRTVRAMSAMGACA